MTKLGLRVAVAGALAQTAGLGIDAWLHVRDPSLASREALLTFGNAGHVLLLGGTVLVLAGVGIAAVGPWVARLSPVVRFGVPVATVLALAGLGMLAATSGLAEPHDAASRVAPGHAAAPSASPRANASGHGEGAEPPPVPLDGATRERLAAELTRARAVAARYPTVKEAEAAGYRAVTDYVPLIGAHYMRFSIVDGNFDVDEPEMLLYDGTRDSSEIVGLSYYVRANAAPEGFAGGNDHWHRHLGLCVRTENPFVLGDEQTTEQECRRRGGEKEPGTDGWMVHAWVVPGWESTEGVFSAENPQLQ